MSDRAIALHGPSSDLARTTHAAFVQARLAEGLRVLGVLEERPDPDASGCAAGVLRNIATGDVFEMSLDHARAGSSCTLDAAGVAAANRSVMSDMSAGCDLVVLSKFGKLEADGGGLYGAFTVALERGIPLATTVGDHHVHQWLRLATAGATVAPPTDDVLDAWWRALGLSVVDVERFTSLHRS